MENVKTTESPGQAGAHDCTEEPLKECGASEEMKLISSLPDCRLDLLICLKELAIRRAKNAGNEELADKLNPKILLMLGDLAVEYVKERMKGSSFFPDFAGRIKGCPTCPPKEKSRKRDLSSLAFVDAASVKGDSPTCRSPKRRKIKEEPRSLV